MAFEKHEIFKPAESKESKLWRYMGLTKYLSLLQKKALFFSNLELMALKDPFEGTLPASSYAHREWNNTEDIPKHIQDRYSHMLHQEDDNAVKQNIEALKRSFELQIFGAFALRRGIFINCWHMNEDESAAMWHIYSTTNEGIAVTTSESRLKKALLKADQKVYGGLVGYNDYSSQDFEMNTSNAFIPLMHKQNGYKHENEYRLVHVDSSETHKNEKLELKPGYYIKCDINDLIENIWVSPLAEDWFVELVEKISLVYEVHAEVKISKLMFSPLKWKE